MKSCPDVQAEALELVSDYYYSSRLGGGNKIVSILATRKCKLKNHFACILCIEQRHYGIFPACNDAVAAIADFARGT